MRLQGQRKWSLLFTAKAVPRSSHSHRFPMHREPQGPVVDVCMDSGSHCWRGTLKLGIYSKRKQARSFLGKDLASSLKATHCKLLEKQSCPEIWLRSGQGLIFLGHRLDYLPSAPAPDNSRYTGPLALSSRDSVCTCVLPSLMPVLRCLT